MSKKTSLNYTPVLTVRMKKEKVFFGPGGMLILQYLLETASFKEACEKAGLSYSKGWKIIKIAEDQLKYQIVDRKQGGKQGGGCTITEKGKELLNRYLDAEKKIKKYADEVFEEVFIAMVE